MSSSDYSACSFGDAVPDYFGPTTIVLKTPGAHYFICSAIGHCRGGMRLAVFVTAAATGGGSTTTPAAPSAGGGGATSQSPPTATITPPTGTGVQLPSSTGNLIVGLTAVLGLWFGAVPGMATVYTVGDSAGWELNVDYGTWASGKTFNVGDSLVFNYRCGHNVAEVSSSVYSACSLGDVVPDSTAPTTIVVKTPGTHYFICGAIGHCRGGMRLAVFVTAAATGGGSTTTPAALSAGGGCATSISPPTATITPPTSTGVSLPSAGSLFPPAFVALFGSVA